MANPKHKPSDEQRRTVRAMSAYGITQADIANIIKIDLKTLRLHYRVELDTATAEANSAVAQSLYNMAVRGDNVTAAIFWLKTRARWSEARPDPVDAEDKGTLVINIVGGLPKRDK
jgi:hypothetical protein